MSDPAAPPENTRVQLPRNMPHGHADIRWLGRFFASVGSQVYSTRGLLKEAEAGTFRLVAESEEARFGEPFLSAYGASAGAAWYVDELCAPKKLAAAAPAELRLLAPHYATDGKSVYHDGNRIAGARPESLRVLSWCYAVDAAACFHGHHKIRGADPDTFRPAVEDPRDWNLYVSADRAAAYYYAEKIPEAGPDVRVQRDERGFAIGITDGSLEWSMQDLAEVLRQTRRPPRTVVLATEVSNVSHHEALFAGLEQRLSFFLMLCSHGSIEGLEQFTRGSVGEKAIVRAIQLLNERAPAPLAQVDATTIRVTPAGMAVHRQFGPVVDVITQMMAGLQPK